MHSSYWQSEKSERSRPWVVSAPLGRLVRLAALAVTLAGGACQALPASGARDAAVRLEVDSFEDFDACTRDRGIDVHTSKGSVTLAPTDYIVHDTGDRIAKVQFGGGRVGKKVFELDALGAAKAELYVFAGTGKATFNGRPIVFRGGGWTMADIRPDLLKIGPNEVVFQEGFALAQDLDKAPPRYSFLSGDAGRTWRPAQGEFLAHLRLLRHPAQGVITSDVIDLANPRGEAIICNLIKVNKVSITGKGRGPAGTSIVLEARSGDTLRPDAAWTDWLKASNALPARYVQWRATLKTSDRAATPVLEQVVIAADTTVLAEPAVTLKEFDTQKIVRSSYGYTFQGPSAKLARLREQFTLDEVVASGATEMEKLVLLRNWVRRQWPHNEGSCTRPWDAIDILSAPAGDHGMCVHFAVAFTQCALALGYNARQIVLQHHYVSDVWSNEHQEWVLMDVEAVQPEGWDRHGTALYVSKETGEPLTALDLHRARDRALARNADLVEDVVQIMHMTDQAGEHRPYERQYAPKEYNNFWHFAYTPRNNYLDQLEPWEVAHGVDSYRSEDYLWWKDGAMELVPEYSNQTNRAGDLYWTVNQAAVTVTATEQPDRLAVALDTVTPNLEGYLCRLDGGEWQLLRGEGDDPHSRRAFLNWTLHAGVNTLEVKPCNLFGLDGILSKAVVER